MQRAREWGVNVMWKIWFIIINRTEKASDGT